MPTCVTCGCEDFESCDGLFYCTTCQTQTQDLRVEMEEASFIELPSRSLLVKPKRSSSKKIKKVQDKGRPWTIYEGYQFILKEQVKALIMLGAHPKLDEVVFRLWALYLSKIEIAFCADEKLVPVSLEKFARHRELFRGDMENPDVKPKRAIRGAKRACFFSSKSEIEKEHLKSSLKDEEFYEGDNPIPEPEKSDDESSICSEQNLRKEGTKQSSKRNVPSNLLRIQWMHLHKNLSFCLLGLMFTNNLTTASDLIRWIKEGTLPFMEVTSLLPSDTKFSAFDVHLFKCEFPTASGLRYETAKMAHFLELEEFPPFPIEQLISKYILHMDLPGEMHGFVMNLVQQQHPRMQYFTDLKSRYITRIPPYEAIAMSYIIITIKLWFGLDDHTERYLSTYSRKLMKFTKNRKTLFVFEDWKTHMTVKFKQHINQLLLLSNTSTMDEMSDVHQILDSYLKTDRTKQRHGIQYSKEKLRKKTYNEEYRKAIRRPFISLSEKLDQNQSIQNDDQSNSSHYSSRIYDDPMDVLNESLDKDFTISSPSKPSDEMQQHGSKSQKERGDYFRQSTLRHITHSKEFVRGLNDGLDDQAASHSTSIGSKGSQNDHNAADLMDVSFENEDDDCDFEDSFSLNLGQGRHLGEQSQPASRNMKQEHSRTSVPPDGSTESEMNSIMECFVNAQESYTLYTDHSLHGDADVQYHKSYHWLLTVCGAMIESSITTIAECVAKLQSIHVTTGSLYTGTKPSACQYFLKKYINTKKSKLKSSKMVNDDF